MAQPSTTNEVISMLYPGIMQDVIDASRTDFEDAGISATILDELKSLWQNALSETRVGSFPWDALTQNIKREPTLDGYNTTYAPLVNQKDLYNMSTLTEAQLSLFGPLERHLAHAASHKENLQRAQELVRQNAEELARARAEGFVEQVRSTYACRVQENGIIGRSAAVERPAAREVSWGTEGAEAYLEQVRNGVNQQKGVFGDVGLGGPQHNVYKNPIPGAAIANTNNAPVIKSGPVDSTYTFPNLPEYHCSEPSCSIPQLDGKGDGDDELIDGNEDTVNSDSDEFEDASELCVCLYDKVVRNRGKLAHKWKCSLRDGVLITGGKEYPFGKANAEFTW